VRGLRVKDGSEVAELQTARTLMPNAGMIRGSLA